MSSLAPGKVEHAGLQGEHEGDPLVELVVGCPAPRPAHIVLPQPGVRPVRALRAVKSGQQRGYYTIMWRRYLDMPFIGKLLKLIHVNDVSG